METRELKSRRKIKFIYLNCAEKMQPRHSQVSFGKQMQVCKCGLGAFPRAHVSRGNC